MTEILWAAFWTGVGGFLIASRDLPAPISILVTLLKIAVPTFYFAGPWDGTWRTFDDLAYFEWGRQIREAGYTPFSVLLDPEGFLTILKISEGGHVFYVWWTLLAHSLFGEHYYSAVFLNVWMTFVGGFFLVRACADLGFSKSYRRGFLLFFLLHWDVLAWSSFLSLKDVFIMEFTIFGLFFLVKLCRSLTLRHAAGFAVISFLLCWLRFYVPILMLSALGLWLVISSRDPRRYLLLPLCGIGFIAAFSLQSIYLFWEYPRSGNIAFNFIMFFLAPPPWNIEPWYSFLLLPSIMDWALIIPSTMVAFRLWANLRVGRLLLIYLLIIAAFYAVFPIIQESRNRVQVTFIIAWIQFHSFWTLLGLGRKKSGPPSVDPSSLKVSPTDQ